MFQKYKSSDKCMLVIYPYHVMYLGTIFWAIITAEVSNDSVVGFNPYSTSFPNCVGYEIYTEEIQIARVTQMHCISECTKKIVCAFKVYLSFALVSRFIPLPNATILRYLCQHVGIWKQTFFLCWHRVG